MSDNICSKYKTKVETENGTIELSHDEPITEDEIAVFKRYTTEEIILEFTLHGCDMSRFKV